jgi:lipoprotein signal peptidase
VRDFIYIATGIFNIADLYILLGIIVLVTSANKLRPKT